MPVENWGLTPEVLEQAAEAIHRRPDFRWEWLHEEIQESYRCMVRDALPVVVPAIREALVREMIADVRDMRRRWTTNATKGGTWQGVDIVMSLQMYLPANEEGAS
jgi:hypothetical protein